ncbi:MAG: hypothetical protein ACLSDQ_00720 [Adlercreutzia equolifaciens]
MAALAARRRKGGTRFVPPKTAEDAVPVRRIWPDGVCLTDDGEYAKTWRVSDVNYAAASKEDKEAMFLGYSTCSTLSTPTRGPRSPWRCAGSTPKPSGGASSYRPRATASTATARSTTPCS